MGETDFPSRVRRCIGTLPTEVEPDERVDESEPVDDPVDQVAG
jgi:hypothetical protein